MDDARLKTHRVVGARRLVSGELVGHEAEFRVCDEAGGAAGCGMFVFEGQ